MKIRIHKGMDLPIAGMPQSAEIDKVCVSQYAVCPEDFPGLAPRPAVKEGDTVQSGAILLRDKKFPDLALVSPCAGVVKAIVRGERRKILRVVVDAGEKQEAMRHDIPSDSEGIRRLLAESGLLAMVRQRPYGVVPDPSAKVRDIFITTFDSSPLAPDLKLGLGNDVELVLGKAVAMLNKITEGKVYISCKDEFPEIRDAEMVKIEGPHPAGLPGTQIAAIKPINKGETVWTMDVRTLYKIGQLALTGKVDTTCVISIVGPETAKPGYVLTQWGAQIEPLLKGRLADTLHNKRIISGNVLVGTALANGYDSYLHYPYRQLTVIAEGDDVDEFMGWASLSPKKMSLSTSFPGHFLRMLFRPDARLNGARRAMIVSGQYEQLIPMDILPEYLVKAIMARDIDRMEQLGIYEIVPEDFALAEFADTSKIPLQQIVREGLDYMSKNA